MRRLLFAAALALAASAAHADDEFYAGAGISRSTLDTIVNNGVFFSNISQTSWKALVGFRPISFVGVEFDYNDLGGESSTYFAGRYTHSDARAFGGYALGFLPVPLPYLDLYAKVGVARWTLNGNTTTQATSLPGNFFSFSNTGTNFAWGAGLQVHMGKIGARLEYENFNVPNTNGAGITSLDVLVTFP